MERNERIIQFLNDYENLSPTLKMITENSAAYYRKELLENGYTRTIQNTSTTAYTEQTG